MSFFVLFALIAYIESGFCDPTRIEVVLSDKAGARLQKQPEIYWTKDNNNREESNVLNLEVNQEKQVFDGIGGSFMRAGAKLLNSMPSNVQNDILRDLFHPDRAAFTVGKVPIGATDFGFYQIIVNRINIFL